MEKRAQQELRAPPEAEKRHKSADIGSGAAAASAAYARRALAAGLPPELLPQQAARALAAEIGNSALLGLLRPGRELMTVTPPDLTGGGGLSAHPIKAQPPVLAGPLRLESTLDAPEAFGLTAGMWGAGPGGPAFAFPDTGGAHG